MQDLGRHSILRLLLSFWVMALLLISGGGCSIPLYKDSFLNAATAGPTWRPVYTGFKLSLDDHVHVLALAVDPKTPDTVYASTEILKSVGQDRDLIKTIDGGVTWTTIKKGVPISLNIVCIAIDPHVTGTVYVGTADGGLYKSINAGGSWASMSTGMKPMKPGKSQASLLTVNDLAIDPQSPRTIYAATQGGGIYKSTNGAVSWDEVNNGLTDIQDPQHPYYIGGLIAHAIAIDPTNPQIVYAATYGKGVFKSTDGGRSWTDTLLRIGENNSPVSVTTLAIDPKQPATIYAGTGFVGVYKTSNAGETWGRVNSGLGDVFFKLRSLMIDPQNTNTVYAGTQRGVVRTTNGGQNWKYINSGIQLVPHLDDFVLAINPLQPQTMYVGTALLGIYKSSNVGEK